MQRELSNEELIELRKEYDAADKKRQTEIEDLIVRSFKKLCENIVNANFSIYVNDRDDLISIGLWEIVKCFRRWKKEKSAFKTYLNQALRWKMQAYSYKINNIIDVDRNVITKANNWKNQINSDDDKLSMNDLNRIAEEYNTSPEQIEKGLNYLNMKSGNSLWTDTEDEHVFVNVPSTIDISGQYEDRERSKELSKIIRMYCDDELEFEIFRMYFDPFDEGFTMSVAEIAETLNKTIGMASRRLAKIKEKITSDENRAMYLFITEKTRPQKQTR